MSYWKKMAVSDALEKPFIEANYFSDVNKTVSKMSHVFM